VAERLGALAAVEATEPCRGGGVAAVLAGEHGHGGSGGSWGWGGEGGGRCGRGRVSPEILLSACALFTFKSCFMLYCSYLVLVLVK